MNREREVESHAKVPFMVGYAAAVMGIAHCVQASGWSRLHSLAREHVFASVRALEDGELRSALQSALDPAARAGVRDGVLTALRVRASLQIIFTALADRELEAALRALDSKLTGEACALDVLDDDEYADAVRGAVVDETTWWGRRAAHIRALPMAALEQAIRRLGAPSQRVDTPVDRPPAAPQPPPASASGATGHDGFAAPSKRNDVVYLGPVTVDSESLSKIHELDTQSGVSLSREQLEAVLCDPDERVFVAIREHRIVAVVHARRIEAGGSIGASDIIARGRTAEAMFGPPRLGRPAIVCYAALTDPSVRKEGVAGELVTRYVLPVLSQSEEGCELLWITSSPFTAFVQVGRELAGSGVFLEMLASCDAHLTRIRPAGAASLRELIAMAESYLNGRWLTPVRDGEDPYDPHGFFVRLYGQLPTHSEVLALRDAGEEGRERLDMLKRRIADLYLGTEVEGRRQAIAHRAAFALFFIAAAMTQVGVYRAEDGKLCDPVQNWHCIGNGARVHPTLGPLPNSRPDDVASVRMGQTMEYGPDWIERMARAAALIARRRDDCRARGLTGVQVDREASHEFLGKVLPRTAEFLRLDRRTIETTI